jgi:hypothetical protein
MPHPRDHPQVADDQCEADAGGRAKSDVHGHVVDQIREQQVERKERRRNEPVVHRMERGTRCRADHDHDGTQTRIRAMGSEPGQDQDAGPGQHEETDHLSRGNPGRNLVGNELANSQVSGGRSGNRRQALPIAAKSVLHHCLPCCVTEASPV